MKNSQNSSQHCSTPPKFARRSLSPYQYMNSQEYRTKIRSREIHVNFGYLPEKKLEKVGIKKKYFHNFKSDPEKTDLTIDKTITPLCSENSFLKTTDFSSLDKIDGRYIHQHTNDTQILKNLDQDSLQDEFNIHSELYAAQKKIFQLERQLQEKNRKLFQGQQLIQNFQLKQSQSSKKLKKCETEIEKLKIKLTMSERKNQEYSSSIRKLKAINWMRRDRIMQMEKPNHHRKVYTVKDETILQLSPQKDD